MKKSGLSKVTGFLFFIIVVVYIASMGLFDSLLHEEGNRSEGVKFPTESERKKLYIGCLLEIVNAFGVIGIATCVSKLLWDSSQIISTAYLSIRIIECCLFLIGILLGIIIIKNSATRTESEPWDITRGFIHEYLIFSKDTCLHLGILACGISGFLMNSHLFLFESGGKRLCPWWVALFGRVAYFLTCIGCLMDIAHSFELREEGAGDVIHIPTMIFEVVIFPLWLIFRGFGDDVVPDKVNED